MMKKTLLSLSALAFFAIASTAFAQGFVPLAPITGLTDPETLGSVVNSTTLANFFNNLYKFLIGIAAVLAVIEIIWGGLEISTKDSVSKQSDGRNRITQAIFGLVLVLSPVLVFSIINPSILNLSLNLPKLDTVSVAPTGIVGGGTIVATIDPDTECSVRGVANVIQHITCPSEQKAGDWMSRNCRGMVRPGTCKSGSPCNRFSQYCEYESDDAFYNGEFVMIRLSDSRELYAPLASANGSAKATDFINACHSANAVVCIDDPDYDMNFFNECSDYGGYTGTPPENPNDTERCTKEALSCLEKDLSFNAMECEPDFTFSPTPFQ